MSEDTRESLVVLVPCLNEEKLIAETVADILSIAPRLPLEVKVVLIDDGSTDGTRAEMTRICAENPACSMRVNEVNLGLGRSVMDSYADIEDGTWVTVMPGDNEVFFESIIPFVEMREEYDLILGYWKNPIIRPMGRRLGSNAYMRIVRVLFAMPWAYINGTKLYRVDVFKGIEVESSGHAYNAELISKAVLRAPFLRITEAPFITRGRAQGTSKAMSLSSVSGAMREIFLGRRAVSAYRRKVIED
jgi:glycosyltransferase involved in cell wall biosynthesis